MYKSLSGVGSILPGTGHIGWVLGEDGDETATTGADGRAMADEGFLMDGNVDGAAGAMEDDGGLISSRDAERYVWIGTEFLGADLDMIDESLSWFGVSRFIADEVGMATGDLEELTMAILDTSHDVGEFMGNGMTEIEGVGDGGADEYFMGGIWGERVGGVAFSKALIEFGVGAVIGPATGDLVRL